LLTRRCAAKLSDKLRQQRIFMRPINKEELYDNLAEFLKTKGVSLQNGSYTRGIQAGCSFLADAINLSQAGLSRARNEIEKQLNHARQVIHEKTAAKGRAGARGSRKPKPNQGAQKRRGRGRGGLAGGKAKRNPGNDQ
jgi:Cdc6-like AAA superfamily ATPase